jgi:hypothetical protein
MPTAEAVCLKIAIERLSAAEHPHYAIWVLESPYPGGYVHHDQVWSEQLQHLWHTWLEFFSLRGLPQVPHVPSAYVPQFIMDSLDSGEGGNAKGYTSRLMQTLGVQLWNWLFDGPVQSSLDQSLGIAMGQDKPLRLCLDIRDPDLISLPWEIMQSQPGRQALSLTETICFSRTTSDVDPLANLPLDRSLQILLVLGQDDIPDGRSSGATRSASTTLQLQAEADTLKQLLQGELTSAVRRGVAAPCQVDVLLQPSPAALTKALERGKYNVFFYAGHGVPAPDGGLLFLQPQAPMNGTELAQVLTRCRVKLAVFNTCWGAQPDQQNQQAIARSSLAEVLLHHGVPAVLAMRDSIADEEALSFIQAFATALTEQQPVDRAVAIARQQLLTLYKFNQPAWTLPVLYLHPDFDGQILAVPNADITRLPGEGQPPQQIAAMRSVDNPSQVWPIYGGLMRVGRLPDNDLVISEPWVSSKHAEIFCRQAPGAAAGLGSTTYYLRDYSRYGTLCHSDGSWYQVHRQEIPLTAGTQLRFGSPQGRLMEFVVETGPGG